MKITTKELERIIEEEVDKYLLENNGNLDEGVLDRLFGLSGKAKRAGKKVAKAKKKEFMGSEKADIKAQIQAKEKEALTAEPSRRNELAREIDQLKASLKGTAKALRKKALKSKAAEKGKEAEAATFVTEFKKKWGEKLQNLRSEFEAEFKENQDMFDVLEGDADTLWKALGGSESLSAPNPSQNQGSDASSASTQSSKQGLGPGFAKE